MADVKISGLPASTVPLAGTEVLPIVQGGATKQVSIANVTAGRAISASTVQATTTVGVGAATPAASGAGITFPATQSPSSNANTLDDYEESTYTATLAPETSGTITLNAAVNTLTYTKIGRLVTVTGLLQVSAISTPVGSYVSLNLPFTSLNNPYAAQCGGTASRIPNGSTSPTATPFIIGWNSASLLLYYAAATTAVNDQINFSFTYVTA
jgi:hypothetical protein